MTDDAGSFDQPEAPKHRSSLNVSETLTRVVTGVAGGAALIAVILYGDQIGITFLAALLAGVMCWELTRVFYSLPDKKEKTYALLGTSWLIIFVNLLFPKSMLEAMVAALIAMFMYFLATADRHANELKQHFNEFIATVFALAYVVIFVAFLPLLRAAGPGRVGANWVLLFLTVVWAGDTGAYFIGHKYGRRKLYPLISPGKSVEGAIGGLVSSLVFALLFKFIFFKQAGWFSVVFIALIVGAISQIGDLSESFFKRAYGIKDSGNILPGHGGFLDRFDGVLFSLPVMYFCVKLFGG